MSSETSRKTRMNFARDSRKDLSPLDREILENALKSKATRRGPDGKRLPSAWIREFYIKESIKKALVGLHDDDICYLSDLDEVWNPELLIDYSKDDVFKPKQLPYMYYLNNRSNEDWLGWSGTIVTKYKNVKNGCADNLRTDGVTKYVVLQKGGWHFGMQGGVTGAKKKISRATTRRGITQKTSFPLSRKALRGTLTSRAEILNSG